MIYIKSIWLHERVSDEVLSYHEIGEDSYEIKKVHIMWDSTTRYADVNHQTDDIFLCPVKMPSMQELKNLDEAEFRIYEITKEEFYKVWNIVIKKK